MAVKVVLELKDEDLAFYRRVMDSVWKRNQKRHEKELVDGARRLLKQATKAGAPEYVRSRLADLEVLDCPRPTVGHQDRSGAPYAIHAGV